MAFDIDDPETELLVRSLAERWRVSPEEAIRRALANELQETSRQETSPQETSRIPVRPLADRGEGVERSGGLDRRG
ncbi:type II toxin-antitoxin system VapB family antitoxin [Methylobacterium sp. W2]|uniref:type II toxin-antitoxin system VapB family antitoxin n=1 Tax=Methylobacterium sp. W2 TaxID=2598107 RepID=UPI001D0C9B8D